MSKTTILTAAALLLVAGVIAFVLLGRFTGGAGVVGDLATAFMEDLQFKDFRQSARYHHQYDQERLDIGRSIEKLFLVKPEQVDIKDFRVAKAEVDSTGDRARTLVKTRFRILNKPDVTRESELVLYWMRLHPDCPDGSECVGGSCQTADGEPVRESSVTFDDDEDKNKQAQDDDDDADDPVLTCDATAEKRWFMNLDSTLKDKKYKSDE